MSSSTASEGGIGLPGMLRGSAAGRTVSWLAGALVVWFLCANLLPHGAPTGVVLSGIVFGAINSLVAISIVLVYRANRVINFAAAEFGAVAAVLAIELHIQVHLNYFLCILTGLVVSAALGAVTEMTILRPSRTGPMTCCGLTPATVSPRCSAPNAGPGGTPRRSASTGSKAPGRASSLST